MIGSIFKPWKTRLIVKNCRGVNFCRISGTMVTWHVLPLIKNILAEGVLNAPAS